MKSVKVDMPILLQAVVNGVPVSDGGPPRSGILGKGVQCQSIYYNSGHLREVVSVQVSQSYAAERVDCTINAVETARQRIDATRIGFS